MMIKGKNSLSYSRVISVINKINPVVLYDVKNFLKISVLEHPRFANVSKSCCIKLIMMSNASGSSITYGFSTNNIGYLGGNL